MTEKKKREPPFVLAMGFNEALARLAQTDPKDLADTYEQVQQDDAKVDKYVEEREQSIRRGARRAGKRFRL